MRASRQRFYAALLALGASILLFRTVAMFGQGAMAILVPGMSGQVESVEVHHLVPRGGEVTHELLLGSRTCVDLREGPQLRVRPEDEVDAGA